jgi:Conjugative transposon protein TcpC
MVRRSTLDRGPHPDMHDGGSDIRTPLAEQGPGNQNRTGPWRGAGGRWAVWTLRAVIWLVLIVVGVRGVIAIALGQTTPSHSSGTSAGHSARSQFPSSLAGAYALQFGSVYLNFSQANQAQRAQQLAAFLPNGVNPDLGWNKAGSLTLQSDQVAGISVQDAQHAVVTLLARVNGHLMELGVPVYAADGAMVVSGEPAWLGAPPRISPPAPSVAGSDSATESSLTADLLPGFFQAYASGSPAGMARFLAHGASVTGLDGAVTYSSISSVYVPKGGDTRQITVTVVWQIPGQGGAAPAQLQMTYDMTVVSQSANWYVQSIRASAQPTRSAS